MVTIAIRRLAILSLGIVLAIPTAADAAKKPSYNQLKQQVKQLTHSRNAWRLRADYLSADLSTARKERDANGQKLAAARLQITAITGQRDLAVLNSSTLTKQLGDANAQIGSLQNAAADLTGQRDRALSGLPSAISAVPLADFPRLVFNPARAAWPCDSFFQSGSYWSYSFDSPGC